MMLLFFEGNDTRDLLITTWSEERVYKLRSGYYGRRVQTIATNIRADAAEWDALDSTLESFPSSLSRIYAVRIYQCVII